MNILSLYDGMACGMIALLEAGVQVDRYVAYEIDKYAIQTSSHNFPMIEHRGDVFKADFTEFEGFDFVMGGSPCTKWSIAQKNGRETEASGEGWEWFQQYVRAVKEAKPKYFIYENNKSMSKAIRASIDDTFGFEAVLINSALVSAQNRQRLYWVGKRNEDGTYSKVDVEQPEDRGILLKDILESGVIDKEKAYCLKHQAGNTRDYFKKHHTQIACEPVGINTTDDGEKARTLMAGCYKYGTATLIINKGFKGGTTAVAEHVAGLCAIPLQPMLVKEATKKGYTTINVGGCVDMTQPNSKTRRGRNMADKSNCLMTSCQYYQYCGVLGYATPCEWDEDGKPVDHRIRRLGGLYDQVTRWGIYDTEGNAPTLTASMGMGGGHIPMIPIKTIEEGNSQTNPTHKNKSTKLKTVL